MERKLSERGKIQLNFENRHGIFIGKARGGAKGPFFGSGSSNVAVATEDNRLSTKVAAEQEDTRPSFS